MLDDQEDARKDGQGNVMKTTYQEIFECFGDADPAHDERTHKTKAVVDIETKTITLYHKYAGTDWMFRYQYTCDEFEILVPKSKERMCFTVTKDDEDFE